MKKLFGVMLILSACVVGPKPDEKPVNPDSPVSFPGEDGEEILAKGWSPDYTAYIKRHLSPEMMGFPAPSFCKNFSSLNEAERRDFWAALLEATAYPESGFDRFNTFIEHGIPGVDPVTGMTIASCGLLQVSYGDAACRGLFDYKGDKARPKAEVSIFHPYKNLQCGINIWTALIRKYGNGPSLRSIGGKYWSTIRDGKVDAYFKRRFPRCF